MSGPIKQIVTVRAGGVVEVCSPQLREGDKAQVTIVVVQPAGAEQEAAEGDGWRRFAGAANSGDSQAGDNRRIDAELAAEYGSQSKVES